MEDSVWSHATLLLSKGGLGIGKSEDLSLSSFLSTSYAYRDLVSSLLFSESSNISSDPHVQEAEGLWEAKSQCLLPPVENKSQQ